MPWFIFKIVNSYDSVLFCVVLSNKYIFKLPYIYNLYIQILAVSGK